jgi:SAM-dependent methyltransferase
MTGTSASTHWAQALATWAIPDELLARAPRSPWGFDPAVFRGLSEAALARAEDSPSDARARAALPVGGSLLDVGAGAGAASLRLHDAAGAITAVDPSTPLLDALSSAAEEVGVPVRTIAGSWPESADAAGRADVVVCHHVLYNVPDLAPFITALDRAARRLVVVELTDQHPLAWMHPLWLRLHDLERPTGPTADDALAVLAEVGISPEVERWHRSYAGGHGLDHGSVERVAQRLCLPPARHDELRAALAAHPPPEGRDVITVWWAPAA